MKRKDRKMTEVKQQRLEAQDHNDRMIDSLEQVEPTAKIAVVIGLMPDYTPMFMFDRGLDIDETLKLLIVVLEGMQQVKVEIERRERNENSECIDSYSSGNE